MNKIPIILNKIEKVAIVNTNSETRKSKKTDTKEHVIRELYNLRKSFY